MDTNCFMFYTLINERGFYELGDTVSEAITFYQFNDSKNCVVSTDDITTYRTIISADTDRNMFTKF
jgi:hypothetical protein